MEEQEGLQEQTAAGTEATEEEKEREETGQKGRKKEENRGGIKAWLIVLLIAAFAFAVHDRWDIKNPADYQRGYEDGFREGRTRNAARAFAAFGEKHRR